MTTVSTAGAQANARTNTPGNTNFEDNGGFLATRVSALATLAGDTYPLRLGERDLRTGNLQAWLTEKTMDDSLSGNPGGRPKLPAEMREIFQSKGPEAAEILVKHLRNSDPRVAVAAAREILDRAYGKPVQSINVDREERIKLIAVVPQKASSTEEWLKLVGEQRVIDHQPTDVESTDSREAPEKHRAAAGVRAANG